MTMPAAAGEKFSELASQYVPKMALLSSIFIEKSVHKDYAGKNFCCLTAKYTPKMPVFGAAIQQNVHNLQKDYAGGSRRKFFLYVNMNLNF